MASRRCAVVGAIRLSRSGELGHSNEQLVSALAGIPEIAQATSVRLRAERRCHAVGLGRRSLVPVHGNQSGSDAAGRGTTGPIQAATRATLMG
jgi:hypothetical protein